MDYQGTFEGMHRRSIQACLGMSSSMCELATVAVDVISAVQRVPLPPRAQQPRWSLLERPPRSQPQRAQRTADCVARRAQLVEHSLAPTSSTTVWADQPTLDR